MKAKSINGKSPEELKSALKQATSDGFKPTLAIVFISIKQDRKAVCEILHQEGMDILGATSCGLFTNGYQEGYESGGSTVILLLNVSRDHYAILFEDIGDGNLTEAATRIARKAKQQFDRPAFILLSSGISEQGEIFPGDVFIKSMEKEVGPNTKIYGGMAGDDVTFTGSYVFTNEHSTNYGIAALVLDEEKIQVHGMAISGWKPLGLLRTVTRSEEGWVYSIDNKPALEMYLKYLGEKVSPGEDKYKMFENIGVHYPFQVEGHGDPVMRTPFVVDKDRGAIKLDFDMPEGTQFRFSTPPDFDIVENILGKATEVKNKAQTDADALLIFSCAGRLGPLGPLTTQENEGLSEIWNAPMAGFFTYGEYGTVSGERQGFHSTTCCWVALKEK